MYKEWIIVSETNGNRRLLKVDQIDEVKDDGQRRIIYIAKWREWTDPFVDGRRQIYVSDSIEHIQDSLNTYMKWRAYIMSAYRDLQKEIVVMFRAEQLSKEQIADTINDGNDSGKQKDTGANTSPE